MVEKRVKTPSATRRSRLAQTSTNLGKLRKKLAPHRDEKGKQEQEEVLKLSTNPLKGGENSPSASHRTGELLRQ